MILSNNSVIVHAHTHTHTHTCARALALVGGGGRGTPVTDSYKQSMHTSRLILFMQGITLKIVLFAHHAL